jgi:hypothetical protein
VADLRRSFNPPEFFVVQKADRRGDRGMSLLHRVDVSIFIDGKLSRENIHSVHVPHPNPEDIPEDIEWLVDMEDVYAYHQVPGDGVRHKDGYVIPDLIRPTVDEDEKRIVARVFLTKGTAKSYELTGKEWSFPEIPDFNEQCPFPWNINLCSDEPTHPCKKGPPPFVLETSNLTQRIATKIAVEFEFMYDVRLVLKAFGSTHAESLLFAPDHPSGEVEILISNLEVDGLLGVPEEYAYPDVRQDEDFSIYYKLMEFRKQDQLVRIPYRPEAGDGKPCAPVKILDKPPS